MKKWLHSQLFHPRPHFFLFSVLLVMLIVCVPRLHASVTGQVDVASRYIWRGFDLNPYRKPVLQPSLDWEIGGTGLSVNFWGSVSFVSRELNEFDLTLTYSRDLTENLSVAAGFIHYAWYFTEGFRFKDDTTHEVFVSLGLSDFFLEPALTLYYDFTNGDGLYAQLELGRTIPLAGDVTAGLDASLGYNGGQWLAEGVSPGFSDLNVGLTLSRSFGRFEVAASVHYTWVLLDAVSLEDHVWFGISLAYNGKEGRE